MTHERRGVPTIPPAALRPADDERLARVWRRLEGNLATRVHRPRWGRAFVAVAAAAAVFVAGYTLGAASGRQAVGPLIAVGAERPASAGRALEASPPPPPVMSADVERPTAVDAVAAPVAPPPRTIGPAARPLEPPAAGPDARAWRAAWGEGRPADAWALLTAAGGFDAALTAASPAEALTLADLAQAAGHGEERVRALSHVVDRHPGDPRAPIAAFMLGEALSRAGDSAGADRAFAAYRALSPDGDFAEDALARQIDAALAASDRARAHELALEYEAKFPQGRRAAELAAWLAASERDDFEPEEPAVSDADVRGGPGSPAPSASVVPPR